MVVLHLKLNEQQQLLFDVPANTLVIDAIHTLVPLLNHQTALQQCLKAIQSSNDQDDHPDQSSFDTLLQAIVPLEAMIGKARVDARQPLTMHALEHVQNQLHALLQHHLPQPVAEKIFNALSTSTTQGWHVDQSLLWFARHPLDPQQPLSVRLGCNEKTRAVVKLGVQGGAAPPREPAVDEPTYRAMLAWHFARSEEHKRMQEEASRLVSESHPWADPKSLKAHFSGLENVQLHL